METKTNITKTNKPEKDENVQIPLDALVSWPLTNGLYKTEAGSKVKISGKHCGESQVNFDWFEEDACVDCEPQAYPELFGEKDVRLVWNCELCGGGSAKLYKDN